MASRAPIWVLGFRALGFKVLGLRVSMASFIRVLRFRALGLDGF